MNITKAVITAAGKDQNTLPLQQIVDRNGVSKSALQSVVEETIGAGAEEVALLVNPAEQAAFATAVRHLPVKVSLIPQPQPLGYGHALHCAASFVGDDPFLHLVSDHLYVSNTKHGCAQQLVAAAKAEECSVSAVQPTRESMLPYYGTVGGRRVPQRDNLYEIDQVLEKPTPTQAEQSLIVPGLRAGHYLCFFGMHVLSPLVMEILGNTVANSGGSGSIQLSPALAALAGRERYLAHIIQGSRYNLGVKYGLLTAQLALALNGDDRDEVLTQLVDLVARPRCR